MGKIHASILDGSSYCFICDHSSFVGNGYMICLMHKSEFGDVYDPDDCEDYEEGDCDDDDDE